MKKIVNSMIACFSIVLGVVAACMGDIGECPTPADMDRGLYDILESEPEYLTNGTIEIRDKDVEIVYSDAESYVWHVVYKIVDEK